jgi:type II secretory pathway pseudopilin PulG
MHAAKCHQRRHTCRGFSTVEVIVSLSLLVTILSVSAPLVVRHNQLLASHRHYRLALEEASNQLERLAALPESELRAAIANVQPSEFASQYLPGCEMKATLTPEDVGGRLTLRTTWDEPGRRDAPLVLAAWVFPQAPAPANEEEPR